MKSVIGENGIFKLMDFLQKRATFSILNRMKNSPVIILIRSKEVFK